MTVRGSRPDRKPPPGPGRQTGDNTPGPQRLLTERAALLLIWALVIGLIAATLAHLAGGKPAYAALTGGGAFAAAITLLNGLIS